MSDYYRLELPISIICGEDKRFLEEFNLGLEFRQRKHYDEYYSSNTPTGYVTLQMLSDISNRLKVIIEGNTIVIKEY